jgi:hypothetical protein
MYDMRNQGLVLPKKVDIRIIAKMCLWDIGLVDKFNFFDNQI